MLSHYDDQPAVCKGSADEARRVCQSTVPATARVVNPSVPLQLWPGRTRNEVVNPAVRQREGGNPRDSPNNPRIRRNHNLRPTRFPVRSNLKFRLFKRTKYSCVAAASVPTEMSAKCCRRRVPLRKRNENRDVLRTDANKANWAACLRRRSSCSS